MATKYKTYIECTMENAIELSTICPVTFEVGKTAEGDQYTISMFKGKMLSAGPYPAPAVLEWGHTFSNQQIMDAIQPFYGNGIGMHLFYVDYIPEKIPFKYKIVKKAIGTDWSKTLSDIVAAGVPVRMRDTDHEYRDDAWEVYQIGDYQFKYSVGMDGIDLNPQDSEYLLAMTALRYYWNKHCQRVTFSDAFSENGGPYNH